MIEFMPQSSLSPVERSRKSSSIVLQALQGVGRQAAAAIAMGMSKTYEAMAHIATRAMSNAQVAKQIVWGDE